MQNRDLTPWTGSRSAIPYSRDPLASFRREVDRFLNDVLTPGEARSFGPPAALAVWPSLDLQETDQGYTLTAELPGLDPKDVEINLRDNVLVISGEKRAENKEENGGRTYAERVYGRFQRIVPLDAEVDADRVEAKVKNGLLTVELPKNPAAKDKDRRIEIKS
ncbi:MAG TPA: Hsp20/alpha crystallin family protein [Caulobacteraceae bacterium]|jgi:HSP20 family protein|nr:Hsp20/alpha crystallin family protein [Caulobacteraceae bacterium]